ncbi:hypothetical protein K2X85_08490 [bacterium]|nr:hypothetical protein [bacterium]
MRVFGVILSMVCLWQQLGATCSSGGHSSIIVDAIFAPDLGDNSITERGQHSSACCHHQHNQPTPPEDDGSRPHTPYHLCSAAHQIFIIPSNVELPDDSTSSFGGMTFDVSLVAATAIGNSTCPSIPFHQLAPRALSLRAQFQILQI